MGKMKTKEGIKLKKYNKYEKKEKKENVFTWFIWETIFIFAIATATIVLYDMYINIDVKPYQTYTAEKVAEEVVIDPETNGTSEMLENVSKSVVGISKITTNDTGVFSINSEKMLSLGSGIIVSEDGYILTNEHVSGAKYSKCYISIEGDSKEYQGTVMWSDSDIDLSIVKIERLGLTPIKLGDSESIKIGNIVYAIGNPIGLEFERTVTSGIISAVNRTIKLKEDENYSYMEDLIQTDATINSGNSGGPLINSSGQVIGINTVKIEEAEGIGFSIPINIVKPIIEKIKKDDNFTEASLGIYAYDKEVIQYLDEDLEFNSGIYVVSVKKDTETYKKGILEGDIITMIDDVEVNKVTDLRKYIYTKNVGDIVRLTITRNRKTFGVEVKLR